MTNTEEQTINNDQIDQIYDALDRYDNILAIANRRCLERHNTNIIRIKKAAKLSCMLEIMEIVDPRFKDIGLHITPYIIGKDLRSSDTMEKRLSDKLIQTIERCLKDI